MKLQDIIKKINLTALTKADDRDVDGVYISDMISDVMNNAKTGNLWITTQTHKNVVSAANLLDISAVIVPNNKEVPQDTIRLANRFNIAILSSAYNAFDIANKLIVIGVK